MALTKTYRQLYALGDSRLFLGAKDRSLLVQEDGLQSGPRPCCSGAWIISSDSADNAVGAGWDISKLDCLAATHLADWYKSRSVNTSLKETKGLLAYEYDLYLLILRV